MIRKKNKGFGQILLVDTNVLVYLFDNIYVSDKIVFDKVISFLLITYTRIWIPATVISEFLLKKNQDKKRGKQLKKFMKCYPQIAQCPIKVNLNEITLLLGLETDEDAGEADAILQANKAKSADNMFFQDICFLRSESNV